MTYLLSYLAGALTTLNPCVLPMVPFVLAAALKEGRGGPLALMGGLVIAFTAFGTFVAALGPALGLSVDNFRMAGAIVMVVIGVAMLVPTGGALMATSLGPLANGASSLIDRIGPQGLSGQFLTGLLLGLVWSPCAGPSLFAAIGLAAQSGGAPQAALAMFVFSLGAASVMLVLAYGAKEVLQRRRNVLMRLAREGKTIFAGLFLAMGLMVLTGVDKQIEAGLVGIMPDWLVDFTTQF